MIDFQLGIKQLGAYFSLYEGMPYPIVGTCCGLPSFISTLSALYLLDAPFSIRLHNYSFHLRELLPIHSN